MTTADDIKNWLTFSAAIAGLIGLLFAIVRYRQDVRALRAQQDLGRICCDERRMGYFVAPRPSSFKWWNRVTPPQIPTIGGLLKAADANNWTPAMVDGIQDNIDDKVCWKQLYEAFFQQLAWDDTSAKRIPDNVSQIIERAKTAIKKKKRQRNHKRLDPESQLALSSQSGFRIFRYAFETIRNLMPFTVKQSTHQPYPDRHLLYQTTNLKPAILTSCVRGLDIYWTAWDDPLHGESSIWALNTRPIWIHDMRPCIPVSKYEVAALSLALGIDTHHFHRRPKSFAGAGAFGLSLTASFGAGFYELYLGHSERRWTQSSSSGSGYSLLYAKYMACGCLPFGQSKKWTKVIRVDKVVLEGIRSRSNIMDSLDKPPHQSSTDILLKLPRISEGIDSFYLTRPVPDTEFQFGLILDTQSQPLDPSEPEKWSWWKAVAGVAFGGLVPRSTRSLAEAIRFTAMGNDSLGGTSEMFLEEIELLINTFHERDSALELFGRFVKERVIAAGDIASCSSLPSTMDTATSASIFGRYMTLLERLVALSRLPGGSPYGTCMEVVFGSLCDLLEASYKAAVEHGPKAGTTLESSAASTNLTERCRAISKFPLDNLSTSVCAEVARLLIIGRSYQVTVIKWPGEASFDYHFETRNGKTTRLMDLESIKDVCALGGYLKGQ